MKRIKLQQQPTVDSCTSACLAMILDKPVEFVMSEFHQDWVDEKTDPVLYLARYGVSAKEGSMFSTCFKKGLHLLTVPSINLETRLHHVLWDWRDREAPGPYIIDPCTRKEGKRWYVNKLTKDLQEGEVCISGRMFDCEILL